MTEINPLAGSILGSAQAQYQVSLAKQRQLSRSQDLRKNVAAEDDDGEPQVESTEDIIAIHDKERDHSQGRQQHPRKPPDDQSDDEPHLDLTA